MKEALEREVEKVVDDSLSRWGGVGKGEIPVLSLLTSLLFF